MRKILLSAMVTAMLALGVSGSALAQDRAKDNVKQAGRDTEDAARNVGRATKRTAKKAGRKVKHAVRKVENKFR